MGNLYIFDIDYKLLSILDNNKITTYTDIQKMNGQSEFEFELSYEDQNIKKYNKVGFFDKDEIFKLFSIDDVVEYGSLEKSNLTAKCIDDIISIGHIIIEDKRLTSGTALAALTKALEDTPYKVGEVDSFEKHNINYYFISCLTALNDIIKTYECEFRTRIEIDKFTGEISNLYVDLKHRLGQDTGLRFTYDTNLNYIEKNIVDENHFNVLYGRGKSLETDEGGYSRKLTFADVSWQAPNKPVNKPYGQKYVEDLESIGKYGRIEGIYENDNIDDKYLLLQKTYNRLIQVKDIKYSYNISVDDLSEFEGFEHYKYVFGDTIIVIDEESDTVVEARIVEVKTVYIAEDSQYQTTLTLGNLINGLVEDDDIKSVVDSIKDKVDNIGDTTVDDTKFPDTLPVIPILSAKALFASITLEWTFENKSYYTYELFASKIKDFNPDSTNKIFEGKASSFLHEVNCAETWYYRARAKNTHGEYTSFSEQISCSTFKISDSENYFEEAAIKDAVIGELRLDRGWVGQLKGNKIDAKELTVTDGNGKKTLEIDSWGNVTIDATDIKLNSGDIANKTDIQINGDGILAKLVNNGGNNLLRNGGFENGLKYWGQNGSMTYNLTSSMPATTSKLGTVFTDDRNARVNIRSGAGTNYSIIGWAGWGTVFTIVSQSGEWYQINYGASTGWMHNQYLGDIRTVTSGYPTFSGTSLLIRANGSNAGVFQKFSCQPGKQYYCVFTAMKDPVSPCSSTTIGIEGISGVNINPNLTWEQYAFQFTATKTEHVFIAYANGAGNFYIDNIMVAYGKVPTGYVDYSGELYTGIVKIDADGQRIDFEDGTYVMMGRDGFKYYVGGSGHTYCSLVYTGSFSVSSAFYGATMGITLPTEFRNKDIKVLVFPVEYAADTPFVVQKVLCQLWGAINYSTAHFTIRYGCHVIDVDNSWNNKDIGMTVGYIALA